MQSPGQRVAFPSDPIHDPSPNYPIYVQPEKEVIRNTWTYNQNTSPQHHAYSEPQPSQQQPIYPIKTRTFYLLIGALILLLITTIAGWIYSPIATQKTRSDLQNCRSSAQAQAASISSQSPTSSTAVPGASTTTTSIASSTSSSNPTQTSGTSVYIIPQTGCPGVNGSTYTSRGAGHVFQRLCDHDHVYDDVMEVMAPSWDDCMNACASYVSHDLPSNCAAVVFIPRWTAENYVNCFLKSNSTNIGKNTNMETVMSVRLS